MYYTRFLIEKECKLLNILKFILMMCYDKDNERSGDQELSGQQPVAGKNSEELGMRSEEWWSGAQIIKRREFWINGKRQQRCTSPSGEVPKAEGAALAVKRIMLDYRKKRSPLEKGRAEGRGQMEQWMIAVIHAGEEPQKLQNPQNLFQPVAVKARKKDRLASVFE